MRLHLCHEDVESEWQRQHDGKSPLYEYIHLQDKGKLVDVFNIKSSPQQRHQALNDIIRQEIVELLYNNGRGKFVTKTRKPNTLAPQTSVRFKSFSIFSSFFPTVYSPFAFKQWFNISNAIELALV